MRRFAIAAAAILAVSLAFAGEVRAAIFQVAGGSNYTLPSNYNPAPGTPDVVAGTTVNRNGTLKISAPGFVTFTYFGKEAGYRNLFKVNGETIFDSGVAVDSQAPVTLTFGAAGVLPFSFATINPPSDTPNGSSLGYHPSISLFLLNPTTVFALFNDSFTGDKDYDDMVVRMDIAPIPLPAAAWLLIAGLGGIALLRHRAAAA